MTARIFWTLAWLQWRLTVNLVKSGRNRGALERFSRFAAVAAPILLVVFLLPVMLGSTALGVLGGWVLATQPAALPAVVFVVGVVLLIPTGWVLIRPLAMATHGHLEREELLRLLPIPTSLLRHLELVKALLDPLFLVFVPGVLALAPGALLGGRPLVAAVAFMSGVGFLAALACLASLLSLGSQLVLRDRRRGELLALCFVLVLSTLGFLPQLLRLDHPRSEVAPPAGRSAFAPQPAQTKTPELGEVPAALRALPSFQLGQALVATARGQLGGSFLPLGTLWALAALAYGLAAPLHRRLLETPAGRGARRTEQVDTEPGGIPFVSRPVAAVAAVQLRTFLRSVRGRATVAFPPVIGLFIALFALRNSASEMPAFFTSATWAPVFVALLVVFNLHVLTCNQFATSGGGLILELLQPLEARAMLRGRMLAAAILCTATLAVAMGPLLIVTPKLALPTALAITLAGLAAHLSLAPVVALLSALLPKTANLSRLGQEGQPHPFAHLLSFAALGVAALPPAGCILVALRIFQAPWLAPLLTLAWAAVAGLLALAALPFAEQALAARRENLALVAAGR